MVPFDLAALAPWLPYAAAVAIGMGFGAVLEASGFGDSRKLAAQFYLKDLTVLKVMFTAIVVAATLLALSSALGLLDMGSVFVNPTFLVPGIVGGLIMGVGFIIGGFCPGTSLVSASTLKVDGIFFVLGVALGIFSFGETVHLFEPFWNSTSMGRFMLPELLGLSTGGVALAVVLMALLMFALAEVAEAFFGRQESLSQLRWLPHRRFRMAAAGALIGLATLAATVGDPSPQERWEGVAGAAGEALTSRAVYVDPREVAELAADPAVRIRVIDVRTERDHNLFHLYNSTWMTPEKLVEPAFLRELSALPSNAVVFLVSNDETGATAAWKLLVGQGIANVYIVEGGINGWLTRFPPPPCLASPLPDWRKRQDDELAFMFQRSVGDCCNSARPEPVGKELPTDCYLAAHPGTKAHSATPAPSAKKDGFPHKVRLQKKAAVKGGCG